MENVVFKLNADERSDLGTFSPEDFEEGRNILGFEDAKVVAAALQSIGAEIFKIGRIGTYPDPLNVIVESDEFVGTYEVHCGGMGGGTTKEVEVVKRK